MKPVCLVIGAGAGIGGNVGMRFAAEGYHSVLCRRSDQYGLDKLVADIQTEGGEATGFLLNAIQPDTIEKLVEAIERDTGPIETVIYNLGAQIGDRALADTSYKAFEMGWRIATQGLFRLASSVCPLMEARGVPLDATASKDHCQIFGFLHRRIGRKLLERDQCYSNAQLAF